MIRYILTLAPVAILTVGCSSNGPDNAPVVPHPVSGKVLYDGKPAAGVQVTLIPTDAPMVPRIPRNPHAVTGGDGTFAITTFQNGDGAAEGGYQIVLLWPGKDESEEKGEAGEDADRLQGWYDGTHSTLNIRVKSGTNELSTLNLPKVTRPPPVSQGVPGRN